MTQEQIEAKALEEFPIDDMYHGGMDSRQGKDRNKKARAAFIKGCQYAATPSQWVPYSQRQPDHFFKKHWRKPNGQVISGGVAWDHTHEAVLMNRAGKEVIDPEWLDESSPAQPGFSEWISVKDRLPEPTLDVVLLIDHFCETKNYYEVTKWDGGQINSWRVTHWMPLPSPPLNKQP